jgi:flagellar motor component MotA
MVLNADVEMAGRIAHCPACGNRIRVPMASQMSESIPTPAAQAPKKSSGKAKSAWAAADPTKINQWAALGMGAGATVLTLLLLAAVKKSFIGQVVYVGTGEWVNYLELLFFFWGLAIVLIKWRQAGRQRSALMLDILPVALGRQITPENVDGFLSYIDGLPARVRESMMVNRIRKGLEMFHAKQNSGDVSGMLSTLSDVDANRNATSYSIVKVFLWAIPILGFIGTVLGLSFAMASFGSTDLDLTDTGALKSAVGQITGGLATAFNTTLLGLLLSMILMFPMSAVQKQEEDCLTEIDAFCNEHLLPRLTDAAGGRSGSVEQSPQEFAESLAASLAQQQEQFLHSLQETSDALRAMFDGLAQQASSYQQKIADSLNNATSEVAKRASQSVEQSVQFSNKYFAALESGVKSLNDTLKALGEKQIVIQQVRKKGLFSRG